MGIGVYRRSVDTPDQIELQPEDFEAVAPSPLPPRDTILRIAGSGWPQEPEAVIESLA